MGYFEMAVGLLFVLALQDLYQRHTSTRNTALMLGIILELRDVNRDLERASAW